MCVQVVASVLAVLNGMVFGPLSLQPSWVLLGAFVLACLSVAVCVMGLLLAPSPSPSASPPLLLPETRVFRRLPRRTGVFLSLVLLFSLIDLFVFASTVPGAGFRVAGRCLAAQCRQLLFRRHEPRTHKPSVLLLSFLILLPLLAPAPILQRLRVSHAAVAAGRIDGTVSVGISARLCHSDAGDESACSSSSAHRHCHQDE